MKFLKDERGQKNKVIECDITYEIFDGKSPPKDFYRIILNHIKKHIADQKLGQLVSFYKRKNKPDVIADIGNQLQILLLK